MNTAIIKLRKFEEMFASWAIFAVFISLAILYVYFVNNAVHKIAEREKIEQSISELRSKIGELEFSYIKAQESVTLEYAETLGLIEAQNPKFVSRIDTGVVLTLNN